MQNRTIVVIGMGYVGIPAAALLADVPGHQVIGIQRRSQRSGWKIDWINEGKNPFEGDEPGMDDRKSAPLWWPTIHTYALWMATS